MAEHFFEDGFDYKKYINDRLLEIEDTNKRSEIKEVVADMLLPFYEHMEESYQKLEQKMCEAENEYERNFQIITGIEAKSRIDLLDEGMFPMRMEDLEETEICTETLLECLNKQKEYKLYSVFVQADYSVVKEIIQSKRIFRASIKTKYGVYLASARLILKEEYLNQIEELYTVFLNNGVEWKTVCAPYLYKFFDVMLCDIAYFEEEDILEITIDFEEYGSYMKYDYIPVWNIRMIKSKSSAYPEFCFDQIHYEHFIYAAKIDKDNDYLVLGKKRLWKVYRYKGDLRIQCEESKPIEWELLEFSTKQSDKKKEFPYMRNATGMVKRSVKTKAEAKKYVEELAYGNYLSLYDVNFNPHTEEEQTYLCDAFLSDEIRTDSKRPNLYFEFIPKELENIWNKDIMSYVVSHMQLLYPEYDCKGILRIGTLNS